MPERNRILLLWKESPYGVQRYFVDLMEVYLVKKGYKVEKFSLSVDNPYSTFEKKMKGENKDLRLVFSLDVTGFEMQIITGGLWVNSAPCICASLLLQPYVNEFDLLSEELGWNICLQTISQDNQTYLQKTLKEFNDITWTPGIRILGESGKAYTDRRYDVCVLEGYQSPSQCLKEIMEFPESFQTIAKDILYLLEINSGLTLSEALEKSLADIDFSCSKQEFVALWDYMQPVQQYSQMKVLEMKIHLLLQQGMSVVVCGEGWEDFGEKDNPMLFVLQDRGNIVFEDILHVVADARILLLNTSLKEDGMQKANLAMASGTVCLTEEKERIGEFLTEEMMYICNRNFTLCCEQLKKDLSEGSVLQNIREKAQEYIQTLPDMEEYVDGLLRLEES